MALRPPKQRRRSTMSQNNAGAYGNSGTHSLQRSKPMDPNILLIPITIVTGIILWLVERAIYSALLNSIPRAVLLGIMFGVLALGLSLIVFGYSTAAGIFNENVITGSSGSGSVIVMLLLGIIVMFGAGTLFQWLYSLNPNDENIAPTSYIFVIDDSGSMQDNDSSGERFRAIQEVLKDMPDDFSYMVYTFSNDASIVKKMGPISDGIPQLVGAYSGGTEIKLTLTKIMDDMENNVWDGGETPKVILLTDGYATDIGWFTNISKILKQYAAKHVSVSTVGLGHVDTNLMNKIAKSTGGVFIDVSDAGALSEAMNTAAREYADRDLLSTRYISALNVLYGFLRVLFLSLLGGGLGFLVAVAYGFQDSTLLIIVSSIVKSVLGAAIMELGTSVLGFSDKFMWLVLWMFLSITLATKVASSHNRRERTLQRPSRSANKTQRRLSGY